MTALRKNAANLTPAEWQAFCNALLAMKKAGVYDNFILRHAIATNTFVAIKSAPGNTQFQSARNETNGAHRGPAFLVWHRAMLTEFEAQMGSFIDSSFKELGIPYWDWTQDPTGQSVFKKDYLGSTIGEVKDGYFTAPDWTVQPNSSETGTIPYGPLRRALGSQGKSMPDMNKTLPEVMSYPLYDSFDTTNFDSSFRRKMEQGLHDPIHVWVGGPMERPSLAPNDPAFYLHHANMDRLFMRWQEMHPSVAYFQDPNVILPLGQNYNDTLVQLKSTPEQIWDYKKLDYTYERPDTIRRFAGVAYTGASPEIGTSPLNFTIPLGSKPPTTSAVQIGFTGWKISFEDGSDHQLLRLRFDCNQPAYAGPVPPTLTGKMELRDEIEDREIWVQEQLSQLLLTDSSTFGALLVGNESLSVSVSGFGERSWSAALTPPSGAEFAMAFFSKVDIRYADASHWIQGERLYIDPMPIDSVPKKVTGKVYLWDASGHESVEAALTLEVLYFSTKVLPSNKNYVLSGVVDKSISTPTTNTSVSSQVSLAPLPVGTVLTVPVIAGLSWKFPDTDHNLRGHYFRISTSNLSDLEYHGYLWDEEKDDDWLGSVHALVLCFSPYWI